MEVKKMRYIFLPLAVLIVILVSGCGVTTVKTNTIAEKNSARYVITDLEAEIARLQSLLVAVELDMGKTPYEIESEKTSISNRIYAFQLLLLRQKRQEARTGGRYYKSH